MEKASPFTKGKSLMCNYHVGKTGDVAPQENGNFLLNLGNSYN